MNDPIVIQLNRQGTLCGKVHLNRAGDAGLPPEDGGDIVQ